MWRCWIDGACDGGDGIYGGEFVEGIVIDGHVLIWYDWYGDPVSVSVSGCSRSTGNLCSCLYDIVVTCLLSGSCVLLWRVVDDDFLNG